MNRRELVRTMRKRGWLLAITKGCHLRFVHEASGQSLVTSNTPSDHRSWRNFLARAKRIERSAAEPA